GGQAPPLLVFVAAALEGVAALVVVAVVAHGSAAAGAALLGVPLLVGGLGDDRDDVAIAQVLADSARRVGLVAADAVGSGAGSAGPAAGDAEVAHQDREIGRAHV